MTIPVLAWTILLAPLAAAAVVLLFGLHRRALSAGAAILGLLTSFACTVTLFLRSQHGGPLHLPLEASIEWIALPGLRIPFGILLDPLSILMTLVVTGVGSAIFIYSTGYMAEERAYSRFFGLLSLFAFSMLTIVLATNWVQLFIGWELGGFCSYLLIGHWYERPSAADAGKKAFMVNRVADFGFMLGILSLWAVSSPIAADRTFHFQTLASRLPEHVAAGVIPAHVLPWIGLLLFCGVAGKSAQFPLHVWLPDAMEGPTPVSALIHAATMVAAGVYLLARNFWLFEAMPSTLTVIMWVGVATAFLAACLAMAETDLKRILAYSTLSQLGYMVMALGLGGAAAGMYHLTTHAFFKALLFLGAGSVIHGTHEQDIRKLGGLAKTMPVTTATFLVGSLALAGVPGLAGFFSKDEILVLAKEHNAAVYILGTVVAGMTAFYTSRLFITAFLSKPHGHGSHAHESPLVMTGPLVCLALLAVAGGYLGIPHYLGEPHGAFHWDVALLSIGVVAAGGALAWLIYWKQAVSAQAIVAALALPSTFIQHRYYIDAFYSWYVTEVQQKVLAGLCDWFEQRIIIGLIVNGIARATALLGSLVRRLQTGLVQAYVLLFLVGVIWVLAAFVEPGW